MIWSEIPQWFWRGKLLHVSKQIWSIFFNLNRSLIKGALGCHGCPPKSDAIYQTKSLILLLFFSYFLDDLKENTSLQDVSTNHTAKCSSVAERQCTLICKANSELQKKHTSSHFWNFLWVQKSATAVGSLAAQHKHTHITNIHNNSSHVELRDDGEE